MGTRGGTRAQAGEQHGVTARPPVRGARDCVYGRDCPHLQQTISTLGAKGHNVCSSPPNGPKTPQPLRRKRNRRGTFLPVGESEQRALILKRFCKFKMISNHGAPGGLSRLSARLRLRSRSHGSRVRAPRRARCYQRRAHFRFTAPPAPPLLTLSLKNE